jgi:hypothetical protein
MNAVEITTAILTLLICAYGLRLTFQLNKAVKSQRTQSLKNEEPSIAAPPNVKVIIPWLGDKHSSTAA